MKVLVTGSDRRSDDTVSAPPFAAATEAIGAALAQANHEVVICSTAATTADYHTVVGANRSASPRKKVAITFFTGDARHPDRTHHNVYADRDIFPNIILRERLAQGGWFAVYDSAISYADAVIGVSGSPRGTGAALYMSLTRGTPVIALPSLGGVSADIHREFLHIYRSLPDELRTALSSSDAQTLGKASERAAVMFTKRNPFPRGLAARVPLLLFCAALLNFALWVTLVFNDRFRSSSTPFAAAAAAALVGLILRYVSDPLTFPPSLSGPGRFAMDATRTICVLLGFVCVGDYAAVQIRAHEASTEELLAAWLSIAAFAAGFLVEQTTGVLTRSLLTLLPKGLAGDE